MTQAVARTLRPGVLYAYVEDALRVHGRRAGVRMPELRVFLPAQTVEWLVANPEVKTFLESSLQVFATHRGLAADAVRIVPSVTGRIEVEAGAEPAAKAGSGFLHVLDGPQQGGGLSLNPGQVPADPETTKAAGDWSTDGPETLRSLIGLDPAAPWPSGEVRVVRGVRVRYQVIERRERNGNGAH